MDSRFLIPYSHPRWWWHGGGGVPVCFGCVHFRGNVKGVIRCTVFSDGIPKEYQLQTEKGSDGKRCIHFEPYMESD